MEEVCKIDESILAILLKRTAEKLEDWLIIGDTYGKIVYVNERVCKTCDLAKEAILGQDLCMFVGIDLADDETLSKIQKAIDEKEKIEFKSNRFVKNHKRAYLINRLEAVEVNKDEVYYICISKDITSTKKLKEELYHINYFDKTTRLPNEKIFIESLGKAIKKSNKKAETFTITLIDIKRISEIHNLYGINISEEIAKEVSKRIRGVLSFKQEIFKYTESMFAVIHSNMEREEVEKTFFKKLDEVIEEPIKIHSTYISVAYRAGNVTYREGKMTGGVLVQMAQMALSKAKKEKGPYIFYTHNIREEAENKMQMELEVQEAIKNNEFIVYYQPFVALESEKIVGMEALLRRRKPSGEIMGPGTFISILEKTNLISKVGMRVLEMVCEQIKSWLEQGYKVVPVSVNLSAVQFKNTNLALQIIQTLEKYNISPKYIVLEITESVLMEDISIAQMTIDELKSYGFAISIDDFGTGYASIGYLKKFMFDHLKIDISFIREIVENVQDRSIVEAIISIAKTLNLKTIAEGIENEEQLYIMSALGCEMGQGFFWDRPISADEIENKYFRNYH